MNRTLEPFRKAVVGRKVSLVWRGHGSAIFLELGPLTPATERRADGTPYQPLGEVSVMIQWSWRIEGPRAILGGSWSEEHRWPGLFRKLTGARVTSLKTFGALPEIELRLSNGLRVLSFMTEEGQPDWALISRVKPKANLHVRRGKLHVEKPS